MSKEIFSFTVRKWWNIFLDCIEKCLFSTVNSDSFSGSENNFVEVLALEASQNRNDLYYNIEKMRSKTIVIDYSKFPEGINGEVFVEINDCEDLILKVNFKKEIRKKLFVVMNDSKNIKISVLHCSGLVFDLVRSSITVSREKTETRTVDGFLYHSSAVKVEKITGLERAHMFFSKSSSIDLWNGNSLEPFFKKFSAGVKESVFFDEYFTKEGDEISFGLSGLNRSSLLKRGNLPIREMYTLTYWKKKRESVKRSKNSA